MARAQLHAQHHTHHTTQQAARLLTPPLALRLGLLLALLVWGAVDLGLLLPPSGVDGGMKMLARDPAFKVSWMDGVVCGLYS